jgi:hypothetical protein
MDIVRNIFGHGKEEMWSQLSREIGAE